MKKVHEVTIIRTDEFYLYINVDNQLYGISWPKCSQALDRATQGERAFIQISPSGYGLHWPLIDEDLAIDPLLKIAEKLETLPIGVSELLVSV